MLRNLVIRILFGLALVTGLGVASIVPALAGAGPSPMIVPPPSPPVTSKGPVQPTVRGITGIISNFTNPTQYGYGSTHTPDASQVPNARPMSGQFAKSRPASGRNDLLQFASTDPDQVIQISQSKLGEDALLRQ